MRKRTGFILALLAALILKDGVSAATLVWANNFESGLGPITVNSHLTATTVADPLGGGSTVLAVSDTGANLGAYGELRMPGNSALLSTYNAVPGVDTFTLTMSYFIPPTTVGLSDDRLTLIVRFSDTVNPGGNLYTSVNSSSISVSTAGNQGSWRTLTVTGTIPTDGNGSANAGTPTVLYATPIIAFQDSPVASNGDNAAGIIAYIDNVQFTVTPEPGRALLLMLGITAMLSSRKRPK